MVDVPLLCYGSVNPKTSNHWYMLIPFTTTKLATWKTMCGTWWLKKNGALRVHVLENPPCRAEQCSIEFGTHGLNRCWASLGSFQLYDLYDASEPSMDGMLLYGLWTPERRFFFKFTAFFGAWIETTTTPYHCQGNIQNMEIWRKQMYRNYKNMFFLVSFLTMLHVSHHLQFLILGQWPSKDTRLRQIIWSSQIIWCWSWRYRAGKHRSPGLPCGGAFFWVDQATFRGVV